jgi:hypothetical protein
MPKVDAEPAKLPLPSEANDTASTTGQEKEGPSLYIEHSHGSTDTKFAVKESATPLADSASPSGGPAAGKPAEPSSIETPPPSDSSTRLTLFGLLLIFAFIWLYGRGRNLQAGRTTNRPGTDSANGAGQSEDAGKRTKQEYAGGPEGESKSRSNGRPDDKEPVDPFVVLGLRPCATKEEIRSAYLDLMTKYHPDKVAHLGVEFQEMARKKALQINAAFEMLGGRRYK